MYCVNCGVKLADTEQQCPLCHTRVYHPDIVRENADSLYPKNKYPVAKRGSLLPQVIVSAVFLLPILIVFMCDMQINGRVTWSGYVMGALSMMYVWIVLPMWFKAPNPVVFVPCAFAAIELYLLYINQTTGGDWFLSFAFPVVGGSL